MSLPLPEASWETRPFWTGGERGELLITRCGACGLWLHPPVPVCRRCRSTDVQPQPVSGCGVVASYTINRQPWSADLEVPYVIAIVELDESEPTEPLRLTTRLIDVDPETVVIGAGVQVVFEQHEDIWLPLFRPSHD